MIGRSWGLIPDRNSGRTFFSRVNFLRSLLFSVRSTTVLLQWHVKDPGDAAKSAIGSWHMYKTCPHPWPTKVGVGQLYCPGIVWEPIRKPSSHATHQGTLIHSYLAEPQARNNLSSFLPRPSHARKKPAAAPPPPSSQCSWWTTSNKAGSCTKWQVIVDKWETDA